MIEREGKAFPVAVRYGRPILGIMARELIQPEDRELERSFWFEYTRMGPYKP